MMSSTLINLDDTIDVRDLAELATECEELLEQAEQEPAMDTGDEVSTLAALTRFLAELGYITNGNGHDLADCFARLGDSQDVTLIREDYFPAYCQELVSDCGYIPKGLPDWIVVNWDETADNMSVDYSEATLDGVTYLVRS